MSQKLTINQRYTVNGMLTEAQLDPNGSPNTVVLWVCVSKAMDYRRLEAVKTKEGWALARGTQHPEKSAIQSWLNKVGDTICNGTY